MSALVLTAPASAEIGVPSAPTYNFYGGVGLLDMPSARFASDGEFSASVSLTPTYEHYQFGFQALPWLETAFRYSRIDRYFGGGVDGDLYDRSLGVKIRLSKEDEFWPSIAVGAQDVLGTGAYGGEYFVASKKFGAIDLTAGVGWRGLSGFSQFTNPFGLLIKSFKTYNMSNAAGTPLVKDFFHGPKAGLFGGIAWNTPIEGLTLFAEASGESYTRERQNGSLRYNTPLNFGFSYEVADNFQIGGGYFYGSEFGFRATLTLDPLAPEPPQRLGTPPLEPTIRSSENSNAAVLALLQQKTGFYTTSSLKTVVQTGHTSSARPELPEVLFSDITLKHLVIDDVETFGDDLVIDTDAGLEPTCSDLGDVLRAAHDAGFKNVALSSRSSTKIQTCTANSPQYISADFRQEDRYADKADSSHTADSNILADAISTGSPSTGEISSDPLAIEKSVISAAKEQNLTVTAFEISQSEADVAFFNGNYRTDAEAMGRIVRILMAKTPSTVEVFRIVSTASNLPILSVTLSRSDIERQINLYGTAEELLPLSKIQAADESDPLIANNSIDKYPTFNYSISPGYRQSLFDPDDPYRFEIYANLSADTYLTRHWNIGANLEYNIYNTFDITRMSNSVLPHVRSDFALYYKHGLNGIDYLQTSYFDKPAPDLYVFARAGLLESMFAGVGGEFLWQPEGQRWAFAGALYAVQQRGYNRLFDMLPYKVITGHVGLYYNSPFKGLDFGLFVGRYLAGDYGATFRVTRRFDSGVEIGFYATLTNVPFDKYGEGSFDKGFIIRIPVDNLLPVNTQDNMILDFTPLTRDGGQMLDNELSIYGAVQRSSEGELLNHWGEVLRP
ncbi:MAG TPA: YjbH domain-containing protein [Rhizomicrobium sp.]